MKKQSLKSILILGIFYFVFLGAEYFFDNMMAFETDADGVVLAQSYILGSSVLGFLSYAFLEKYLRGKGRQIFPAISGIVCILLLFFIKIHATYAYTLGSGLLLFLLLGYFGSGIHYLVAQTLADNADGEKTNLAKMVGCAYALGIFLQFINNNCIASVAEQTLFLSLAVALMEGIFIQMSRTISRGVDDTDSDQITKAKILANEETTSVTDAGTDAWKTGLLLILIVACMTFIFATLDNAVTLVHAGGSVDIGQWPRLLLAASGLAAGFLYDIKKGAYQNIIMYCVMLLSTICVLVISCGGPFILGLLVFYLSAGFFSIYFAVGFMRLSYGMRCPKLWAGLGRAVNNLCAVVTASVSLSLLQAPSYVTIVIALVLFAITSILIFIYQRQMDQQRLLQEMEKVQAADVRPKRSEAELLTLFADEFGLTAREKEVLSCMLHFDDNVTAMASELAISRAALYRHISSMNEKTNTKARMGLVQFYYAWMQDR